MKTLFILLTTIIFCFPAFGQQRKEESKPSQIGIAAPMRRPDDIQPTRPRSTQPTIQGNPSFSGYAGGPIQQIFANLNANGKKTISNNAETWTQTLSNSGNALMISERFKDRTVDCKVTIDKNLSISPMNGSTNYVGEVLLLSDGSATCHVHYDFSANSAGLNELQSLIQQLNNQSTQTSPSGSNAQTYDSNQVPTRSAVNPAETAQIQRLKRPLGGSVGQTQPLQTGELADGKAKGNSNPLAGRIVRQYPVNNDCSTGIVGNRRVCWGAWGSTEGVQVRVKGPIAAGYSTYKGQNTVYYEWRIQIKNPTNNIVCLNYKFTYKGGYRSYDEDIGAGIPMLGGACVVPNGTSEDGGNSESSKTFSPESDVHVDILNVRTCSKWKQNDSTTFECVE